MEGRGRKAKEGEANACPPSINPSTPPTDTSPLSCGHQCKPQHTHPPMYRPRKRTRCAPLHSPRTVFATNSRPQPTTHARGIMSEEAHEGAGAWVRRSRGASSGRHGCSSFLRAGQACLLSRCRRLHRRDKRRQRRLATRSWYKAHTHSSPLSSPALSPSHTNDTFRGRAHLFLLHLTPTHPPTPPPTTVLESWCFPSWLPPPAAWWWAGADKARPSSSTGMAWWSTPVRYHFLLHAPPTHHTSKACPPTHPSTSPVQPGPKAWAKSRPLCVYP